jgi:hypothetical protein
MVMAFVIINRLKIRIWAFRAKRWAICAANRAFDNGDPNDLFWR